MFVMTPAVEWLEKELDNESAIARLADAGPGPIFSLKDDMLPCINTNDAYVCRF